LRIIWVLENIDGNREFYSKLNILLLLASVRLWKRNQPEDTCVLYTDSMTRDLLHELNVHHFWDEISLYKPTRNINTKVFWAASKLEILAKQTVPVIIMDNDTLVFKPIKEYLDLNKVYVCNFEVGKGYYPTAIDPYIQQLSYRARWKTESVNVSFLNLPDPKFTKEYANMSLKFMEEFTKMKVPHSQYLIFAEQLLLKHLLDKKNIEYKSILSTNWDCKKWEWGEDHDKGIWTMNDSGLYFKHYGPLKSWIKKNLGDQNYNEEVKLLSNCINFPNLYLDIIEKP
jgi:hypothetical protein